MRSHNMYIGHGHGGMRSATSVGNGGGYMTIPENEELDIPHESNSTVLTSRSSNYSNSEGKNGNDRTTMKEQWKVNNPYLLLSLGVVSLVVVGMGIRIICLERAANTSSTTNVPIIPDNNVYSSSSDNAPPYSSEPTRLFDELGRYIVEDYDSKPPFSDFLPGVAGLYGKPLWCFFVNRGQTVASFGVLSKDYPILEYNPANKAYQSTPFLGFRTFVMANRTTFDGKSRSSKRQNSNSTTFLVEPFSAANTNYPTDPTHQLFSSPTPKRFLYVGVNEIQIQEIDYQHRMETNVSYFILPEESFGALVRRTTFTNIDTSSTLEISALDGLARIEPSGGGPLDEYLKNMGRTLEAWFRVDWADATNRTMPYFKLSSHPRDDAAVTIDPSGHYCLAVIEQEQQETIDGRRIIPLPIVYDSTQVFGQDTTLMRPAGLYKQTIHEILYSASAKQYGLAKTSSAFAALTGVSLEPGKSVTVTSFYGKTDFITDVPLVARKMTQEGYIPYKLSRARDILNQVMTSTVETHTSNDLLNAYIRQSFLDNSLRGGIPMILGDLDDVSNFRNADEDSRLKVFHVFSRAHGDLERDYNKFSLDSTYFSQGPGNFRDILQNRRNDVFFNPRIGAFNVKVFLSYIQADGYNPLTVEATVFMIHDRQQCDRLATLAVGSAVGKRAQHDALNGILCSGPFRPGQLFLLLDEQAVVLLIDRQRFIEEVLSVAEQYPMAVFTDGFWADHWTYYLDLVESYLSLYPEGEQTLLFGSNLRYFFSAASVKPRCDKYVLSYTYDGQSKHVRQLNSTVHDPLKFALQMADRQKLTGWYGIDDNWQRDSQGQLFQSTSIAKLLLLATLKYATRDAYGMGIEYEAGKPGWNDAMNGLPGMIGSGMPETLELKRLISYIVSAVSKYQKSVFIPEELGELMDDIEKAQQKLDESGYKDVDILELNVPKELFHYWDSISSAREMYREKIRLNFIGATRELSPNRISVLFNCWLREINQGINRAMVIGGRHGIGFTSNVNPTYFSFEANSWKLNGKQSFDGSPLVNVTSMRVNVLPIFLEGPTRMIRTVSNKQTRLIYDDLKKSELRDDTLKMYTISGRLEGQSMDMGRLMAFSPGWLENQSVWLHMSFKYYLELLRSKLYIEFYEEMLSGGMPPFMNATMYGRSLVECSSFLASSAFQDPSVQGQGFVARLSGATAEFLNMWILIFIGPKPFILDENTNDLSMQLIPALPLWLFEKFPDNQQVPQVSFRLFGSIHVTYHNTIREDLFDIPPRQYLIKYKDGSTLSLNSSTIPGDVARKIRGQQLIDGIDAFF